MNILFYCSQGKSQPENLAMTVVQKAWGTYGSKICEWKQNQWETHLIKTECTNEDMKDYGISLGRSFKHFYGTYN